MRSSFFKSLAEVAKKRDDIIILTGDLGFRLFDDFKSRYPDRFYDVGVAEANMVGIAAGLSLCGKNVYCYSIAPFLLMRTFEHIRIDIAYNKLNVKLVGVGGGLTYGLEGITHFGLEDLALMRMLPNMTIVVPADPKEAHTLAETCVDHEGPIYIRLGRTGEPSIHKRSVEFEIGKPIFLNEGKNIAVFAIGNMVSISKQVADMLKQNGINITLVNMHTLRPLNKAIIEQIGSTHEYIFTVEEHYIHGGLGSATLEVLAESGYKGRLKRIGIPEKLGSYIGKADYLRSKYGLSVEGIYKRILNEIEEQ